jgi:hypothetical protein
MSDFINSLTDLKDPQTLQGKSFLLYGESGTRKTKSTGTLPGVTLHLSLDSGASSAMRANEELQVGGKHYQKLIPSLAVLDQVLTELMTSQESKNLFDNVVLDNLIEIGEKAYIKISNSPKYKADSFKVADVMSDAELKNAQGSKTLPLYLDTQKAIKNIVRVFLSIKQDYNVILLTNSIKLATTADKKIPLFDGIHPMVYGPSSIKPITMLFDEVYTTSFKDTDLDTLEKGIKTKFKIKSATSPLDGVRWFAKSRYILNLDNVRSGEILADFRLIYKDIGYVLKQDRK